jgi:hypothetical protein
VTPGEALLDVLLGLEALHYNVLRSVKADIWIGILHNSEALIKKQNRPLVVQLQIPPDWHYDWKLASLKMIACTPRL